MEKIRPYLSLGEVLEWMADYPEVLECKKDAHLSTGNERVSIVLRLHREEDTFTVTVYDVSIYWAIYIHEAYFPERDSLHYEQGADCLRFEAVTGLASPRPKSGIDSLCIKKSLPSSKLFLLPLTVTYYTHFPLPVRTIR